MTVREWVKKIGVTKVARLLNVTDSTVNHWRRGFSHPRGHLHSKIVKLSDGKVDMMKSMAAHYNPKNKSRSGVLAKRTRK